MITFKCPHCGSDELDSDAHYFVDGVSVCSFSCWNERLGEERAIVTAAFYTRSEAIPDHMACGTA